MSALRPLRGPFDSSMAFDGASSASPFSPSQLDLDVWLDSAVGVTLTSSAVSQWVDKAKSRVFSQSTAGFRPVMRTVGNITGIDFDGSDDFLISAVPFSTLFGAQNPTLGFAAFVYADAYGTSANNNGAMASTDGSRRWNVGMGNTGFAANIFTLTPTSINLQTVMSLASPTFVASNATGTALTAQAWAASNSTAMDASFNPGADRGLQIGWFASGEAFNGIVFEMFIRRTVFTTDELTKLRAYCLARWGV